MKKIERQKVLDLLGQRYLKVSRGITLAQSGVVTVAYRGPEQILGPNHSHRHQGKGDFVYVKKMVLFHNTKDMDDGVRKKSDSRTCVKSDSV